METRAVAYGEGSTVRQAGRLVLRRAPRNATGRSAFDIRWPGAAPGALAGGGARNTARLSCAPAPCIQALAGTGLDSFPDAAFKSSVAEEAG